MYNNIKLNYITDDHINNMTRPEFQTYLLIFGMCVEKDNIFLMVDTNNFPDLDFKEFEYYCELLHQKGIIVFSKIGFQIVINLRCVMPEHTLLMENLLKLQDYNELEEVNYND